MRFSIMPWFSTRRQDFSTPALSTIDTVKLRTVIQHPYFLPILSKLRMSIGFYLAVLKRSIADNNKLIRDLEKSLKK
ncbi:MAG: hypothetical protein AAFQ94_28150 [Bacteroidota bacterium]